MKNNIFGSWNTSASRVRNAGTRLLKGLISGGQCSADPARTSKPSRYGCRTSNSSASLTGQKASGRGVTPLWMFPILALGIYILATYLTNSSAIASQELTTLSGLSKPPFDINSVIEKAEHLPILRDGYYIVEDSTYTAMFGPRGVIYAPVTPGGLTLDPFSLRVSQIGTSSGEVFWNQEQVVMPVQKENTLVYKRTQDIEEVYDLLKKGVEQSWVLRRNPGFSAASDLRIIMDVKTSLIGNVTSEMGLEFVDDRGNPYVKYSKAVIIDADGKVLEAAPLWDAGTSTIALNISGEWLATAAYPVVVDPILNTVDIAVDTQTTTNESYPAVASSGTNYLVVYQSGTANGTGSGTTDIKGVLVDAANGTPGSVITIGATAGRDDQHPSVSWDSVNSIYLVVWEKWNSGTASDILMRTVTAAGGLGSGPLTVSASTTRIQAYTSVACCDATNAMIAYVRAATNGATRLTQLRATLVSNRTSATPTYTAANPTGTITNTAGPTSSPTAPPVTMPKTVFTNTTLNRYFLVWEDFADTNGNLKAQIYTVGTGWGTQWNLAVTTGTLERYPSASFDGSNFLVTYQRGASGGGNADIYGQFATTAGANLANPTSPFAISNQAGVDETTPGLAWNTGTCSPPNPVNRFMVSWVEGTTVRVRPVTTAGILETTATATINTASIKVNPAIASSSGSCGYLAAWSDNRNGGGTPYDIYAQRVGYPNIDNLSPATGYIGTSISINGMNFGTDPGAGNRSSATNNVKINGVQVSDADVSSWADGVVSFTVPTGTTPGTYPVTVTAESWTSNGSNLTVNTNTLQITTSSLPNGYQWITYGSNVSATGGATPYNWTIISGALPGGVTLNSSSGLISGDPSSFGTFNFTVQVTDSTTPTPQTATQALSILIYELTTIAVTPANPTLTQGQTVQFTATGTYSDNSTSNISSIVAWGTSDGAVATVNSTGLATGVGLGSVTISATK